MLRNSGLRRICGLFLLANLAVGCERASVAPPALAPPRVTVAAPVEREVVEEDDFNGWLQPSASVDVRARVRGHILQIHFRDGDYVEANQLLFELDPRPFQVAIDQATAQANALSAQSTAAEKDVQRYSELVRGGGASRQQLEKAQADAAAYQAQIAAKNEEVKQHQLDLEYSRITAPIAGRIGRAMLTVGNLVNAGGSDPLLTTINAVNPMHVYFSVDERALLRYRERQSAEERATRAPVRDQKIQFRFGLDSDRGFPHQGTIDFADNRVDTETGTIQLRGVVDNANGQFVPGSRVRVRVPVSDPYRAVLVPDSAILSDMSDRYVLVVEDTAQEKNIVVRRNVLPGRLMEDGMRVVRPPNDDTPALTSANRIIVQGLQRARINYPVEPMVAEPGAATGAPPAGQQASIW